MTTPEQQQPDSAAYDHFLSEVERVAAGLTQEPDHEDPEGDVQPD